jgi:hypothetical protein
VTPNTPPTAPDSPKRDLDRAGEGALEGDLCLLRVDLAVMLRGERGGAFG